MKGNLFMIIKILRNIVYIIFAIFVMAFLLLLFWQNINFKPIKINDVASVEKIEISLEIIENNNMSLYKSEITEKDLMQDFCNEMSEIKAKRIVNGGGEDSNITIYIRVYYTGERLEYYTIYGNQILLNDGKKAYQMNEAENQKLREYFLRLCKLD